MFIFKNLAYIFSISTMLPIVLFTGCLSRFI